MIFFLIISFQAFSFWAHMHEWYICSGLLCLNECLRIMFISLISLSLSCQLRPCGPVLEVILFQSPRDVTVLLHTWTGTLSSICYVVVDIHPSSPSRTSVFSEILGTLPIVVASLSTTITALKMAWLASSQFFLSSFYSGFSLFWQFWT